MKLDSLVTELSGVGKMRAAQLSRLGIVTIEDLIYCFPRTYENRSNISTLVPVKENETASYILTVSSVVKNAKIRNNLTVSKFSAFDESASCEIVFFNSPYIKDVFHIGSSFRFTGKAVISKGKISFTNPKFEPFSETASLPDFIPIYHLTDGLSGKVLEKLVNTALSAAVMEIEDPLPDYIRIKNELPTLNYALKNVHAPEDGDTLRRALRRLAFDEMFYFGIGVSLSNQYKSEIPGVRFSPCNMRDFTALLPYDLTDGQKNAINDIYSDTVIKTKDKSFGHMARILVGDVGCGKTVCAEAAIYLSYRSGYQSALMAPTEILARQHFEEVSRLLGQLGVKCELLVGATTQKEKRRIYQAIKSGECDLVIGTHALLSDKIEFKSLGLIITDEQHRFGVAQRAVLGDKTRSAHVLVMSATPIPRTLALAMYGDLDVSRISDMPRGRQRVDTYVVNESYRERLNDFIRKQIELGGQCYVVCPSIDKRYEPDDGLPIESFISSKYIYSNVKNVLEYAENMRQSLKNLKIDVIHGKMKPAEKDKIMKRFSNKESDVLISTTVIEVGVNVPNASLMIIENAERYGLSQLHQLRGRVGRGSRKSYCVLVSDLNTPNAIKRLEIMRTTYDGFDIANYDLEMRGPGDFFSTKNSSSFRQSGGFDFKLANLTEDSSLFDLAISCAKAVVTADPELIHPEHRLLKKSINKFITPIKSTFS